MTSRLTRREFCKLTAAAGVTMVSSADVVATADGAPREVVHNFIVRSVSPKAWPDGAVKKGGLILVNESLPGPTIRARDGDTIVVRLRNGLPEGTIIHWHGMTQLGTWQMDGVANVSQEPIPPGQVFEYRFKAEPAGTHLWHSHTGVQYGEGMFGMLIVDAVDDPYRGDYDVEQTVCINDWFHEPGTQILSNLERGAYMKSMNTAGGAMGAATPTATYTGPDLGDVPYQSALINGKGRFRGSTSPLEVFAVKPKQRVRFRIANIGSTYEMRVCLDGHRMTVIAVDGIPTMSSTVDSVTLDVGERCDVIVEMSQPVGNYWFRANTLDPGGKDGVRAIVRYAGAPAVEPADSPPNWGTELDYNMLRVRVGIPVPAPDLVGTHLLGGTMKPYRWSWDGRSFLAPKTSFRTEPNAPDPPVTQIAVKKGQNVRLILNNPTGIDASLPHSWPQLSASLPEPEQCRQLQQRPVERERALREGHGQHPRRRTCGHPVEGEQPRVLVFPLPHRVAPRHGDGRGDPVDVVFRDAPAIDPPAMAVLSFPIHQTRQPVSLAVSC
jgi:FtsP/CotA-like multicopper oxidase with cupredoxin domain